ncbi:hypothetical protein CBER1_10791 [Cercospora berteroae]|uniref:F-box domain-containing protein n=1 Tax=Cercospora berteroae TaxID=357750 RepID=A0A2S6BZ14_9PEZI|nr:hypothetical protein CBER1_10791 [Cercospora berteroae]
MTNSEKRQKRKATRQEPGEPPAKQIKFKEHFINLLAPELQLAVLSFLPATDIQKCRRVNQYMRSLVNNPSNQVICTGPSITQARNKFDEFIKTHIEFDMDAVDADGNPCAFLHALVALTRLRGIAQDYCFEHTLWMMQFVEHWIKRRLMHTRSDLQHEVQIEQRWIVLGIASDLHTLHMKHKGLRFKDIGEETIDELEQFIQESTSLELLGVTSEQCDWALFQKVAAGAFEGTSYHTEDKTEVACMGCKPPYNFKLVGLVSQLGRGHWASEQEIQEWRPYAEGMRNGQSFEEVLQELDAMAEKERQREEDSWIMVQPKPRAGARNERHESANGCSDVESEAIGNGSRGLEQSAVAQAALSITYDDASDDALSLLPDRPTQENDEIGPLLSDLFGLPQFPTEAPFAYYCRSRRLVGLSKEVLQGEKTLTPLRKAAILNSIHIW